MFSKYMSYALLCAAPLLAACVTTTEPVAREAPKTAKPSSATEVTVGSEEGLAIGSLDAQRLETGQCGLFLFAAKPSPRLVFFGEASSGLAKVKINGRELTFARNSYEGEIIDQHYTTQSYNSADLHRISISFVAGRPIEDGTQIESGSMRVESPTGWSVVVPVSGATSCKG